MYLFKEMFRLLCLMFVYLLSLIFLVLNVHEISLFTLFDSEHVTCSTIGFFQDTVNFHGHIAFSCNLHCHSILFRSQGR